MKAETRNQWMGWQLLQCEAFGVSLWKNLVLISLTRRHFLPWKFNHHARYRRVSCTSDEDRAEGYGCRVNTLTGLNVISIVPELAESTNQYLLLEDQLSVYEKFSGGPIFTCMIWLYRDLCLFVRLMIPVEVAKKAGRLHYPSKVFQHLIHNPLNR